MNYIVQCTCVKILIEIIRKDDIKLIMIYLVLCVGFNVYVETFLKKRNEDAFQRTLSRIIYNFLLKLVQTIISRCTYKYDIFSKFSAYFLYHC